MLDFNHVLATPNYDIQTFYGTSDAAGQTTSNITDWRTWVKPRGINWVYMIGVGAGSSGGNGVFTGADVSGIGGPGGGSGSQTIIIAPAFLIPSILYIKTGLGGIQTSSLSGAVAVSGGGTYVTMEPVITTTGTSPLFFINSGGGSASTGGTVGSVRIGSGTVVNGQNGVVSSLITVGSITLPQTGLMITGGASGGYKATTGGAQGAGGNITGIGLGDTFPTLPGGVASSLGVGAGAGANGFMVKPFSYYGGSGGGGGGFVSTGLGSIGGAGGNGGPGCGGGGSGAGYVSVGIGGRGGDGFVIIISW